MPNFEVIHKEESIYVQKETGTEVNYFIVCILGLKPSPSRRNL